MEIKRDEILEIVIERLLELNADLNYEFLTQVSHDTPIYGSEYSIDSLALVRFAVDLEETINDRFGCDILLTDALAHETNPYASVGGLVEFIMERVAE